MADFAGKIKRLLATPISTHPQYLLVIIIALLYGFMLPVQANVNDWALNTDGLWEEGLSIYQNPNRVYPPWGLILLIPFRLMHIEGARFFSVLTIAWLAKQNRWPLYSIIPLIFAPYFLYTMYLSNMDILVIVFPIVLWQVSEKKSWQWLGRGCASSILLVKPQATWLICLVFLWQNRNQWKSLILPLCLVAVVTIPISLAGSPPLILQWLDNIMNPSPQNQSYWIDNNISLSNHLSFPFALVIILLISTGLFFFYRKKQVKWESAQITGTLLMLSMLISPYTSRQSVSAGLAFVPSWASLVLQYALAPLLRLVPSDLRSTGSLIVTVIFSLSQLIYLYIKPKVTRERVLPNNSELEL